MKKGVSELVAAALDDALEPDEANVKATCALALAVERLTVQLRQHGLEMRQAAHSVPSSIRLRP